MDILDIIKGRRSIREYIDKDIEPADLEKILEAGRWAPSGLNNQPWKFGVLENKDSLKGLSKFTKYSKILQDARLAICVFLDYEFVYNRDKDLLAIGACIENMLLEAHSLGIASCWLGEIINRKNEVQEFLNIGKDLELMAVVAFGFSAERLTESCRKSLKALLVKSLGKIEKNR